ncbi:SWI/SNF-related matrix-associated actin-dependent regulator of chromatin [Achlya hypogyna]|uniref:SWI/SNF-related matrix-associated actin-dependent regulator of chromatin n=1 Tax=Achlya hypogyna TaxID=1202772 RepID=A0A1V9YPW7_ACHHY|nr:SWI/SNF-related matrix-associated actin-dependent regulator of chromatin [Achlya hypogyna]
MAEDGNDRKRKAVDLLSEVETCDADQYATYKQLKAMDEHLTATIHRNLRRLETQVQAPPQMAQATLVVSMSYSYDPTAVIELPDDVKAEDAAGQWTFRVEATIEGGPPSSKKFSHFFRKAIVDLDDRLYALPNSIEWSSFRSGDESDGFEIRRPGKTGFSDHMLRLQLVRQLAPERFNLSPALFAALAPYLAHASPDAQTRADVVKAAWDYIKMKDLLHVDDCRTIENDEAFAGVFDCKEMPFQSLLSQLQKHLTPTGPVTLEYRLPLDGAQDGLVVDEQRFQIEVPLEEELNTVRKKCLATCTSLDEALAAERDSLQNQMDSLAREINRHVTRREWMVQFTADPLAFMDRVVASQDADQELLALETQATPDAMFQQPWVHSTMELLLNRE